MKVRTGPCSSSPSPPPFSVLFEPLRGLEDESEDWTLLLLSKPSALLRPVPLHLPPHVGDDVPDTALEGAGQLTDQVLGALLVQPKLEVPCLHAGQPYEA